MLRRLSITTFKVSAITLGAAALTACATFFPPKEIATTRGPANVGGLNDSENQACEAADGECRYFIAPCSLKEHSPLYRSPSSTAPQAYMSLKEEYYLDELEDLSHRGYCQLTPRALPAEQYNHDTCMYVFVKKDESCNP